MEILILPVLFEYFLIIFYKPIKPHFKNNLHFEYSLVVCIEKVHMCGVKLKFQNHMYTVGFEDGYGATRHVLPKIF